jgi:hypothetical protein
MKKAFTLTDERVNVLGCACILAGMFLLPMGGCHKPGPPTKVESKPPSDRFIVEQFRPWYGPNYYIFSDTLTKHQYLSVSSCGIIELHSELATVQSNKIGELGERP